MIFTKKKRKKLGLALGGGAARGIAHVGIVKAFSELGLPIDYLAGTSAGSIVGSLFAAGVSIERMLSDLPALKWRDFAKFQFSRKGMFSSKPIEAMVRGYLGAMTFRELSLPFAALATDIMTGQGVILNDPDLEIAQAVRASSSFPGVYQPTQIGDAYYFDGGAAANVPASVVRSMGADVVISVDVIPKVTLSHMPRHMATLTDRGLDLLLSGVSRVIYIESDLVLTPLDEQINSFQVNRWHKMVDLGEACVHANVKAIEKLL